MQVKVNFMAIVSISETYVSNFETIEPVADASKNRTRLQSLSRRLLKSGRQAEVGAAIAEANEPVWGAALLEALSLDDDAKGMMSKELARLRKAELLVPDPETGPHDRRKPLRVADREDAYWALCRQLRSQAGVGRFGAR
ncbi:MAG TPA: hypothetical protein VIS95_03725 [Solirubrobacterales bacterium]